MEILIYEMTVGRSEECLGRFYSSVASSIYCVHCFLLKKSLNVRHVKLTLLYVNFKLHCVCGLNENLWLEISGDPPTEAGHQLTVVIQLFCF